MPAYSEDRCTVCGDITSKELLTIKRVSFANRTTPQRVKRSRTVHWLCEGCLEKDPDWHREAWKGSPGMTSAPLERVRSDTVL